MKLYFDNDDDTHRAFVVGSTGSTNAITRHDRKTFLRYRIPDVASQVVDASKGIRYSANVLYGLLKIHSLQVTQLLDDTIQQVRHLRFDPRAPQRLALINVKLGKHCQPYREVTKGQFLDNSSICLPTLRFMALKELQLPQESTAESNSETTQLTVTDTTYDDNPQINDSVQLDFDIDDFNGFEYDMIDPAPPLEPAVVVNNNVGDITTDPHFQASTQVTFRHSHSRLFDERSLKRRRVAIDDETQLDLSWFRSMATADRPLKSVSVRLQELAEVWTHSAFDNARITKCVYANAAAATTASDTVAHLIDTRGWEETETGMGHDDSDRDLGVIIDYGDNDDFVGGWDDIDDGANSDAGDADDDDEAAAIEVTASPSMETLLGVNKPFREYMHHQLAQANNQRQFLEVFPAEKITKEIKAVSFFACLALASSGTITINQSASIDDPFGQITLAWRGGNDE